MAATFGSLPPLVNLAESPIVYNLVDTSSDPLKDSYQMVLDLYVYRGPIANAATAEKFTMNKFPIDLGIVGITQVAANFDVSNIVNSFMQNSLAEAYNLSILENQWFIDAQAYSKWKVNGSYVTSTKVNSGVQQKVLDGYYLWGERQLLYSSSLEPFNDMVENWPILSSAPSNVSQSISDITKPFYFSGLNYSDSGGPSSFPKFYVIEGSNGSSITHVQANTSTEIQNNSQYTVNNYVITGSDAVFQGSDWVNITTYGDSSNVLGQPINIKIDCQKKYTPTRIIFKNRYGAFDNFEFSLVSNNTFEVETKEYKANALNSVEAVYNRYDGSKTFYTDGGETLTVNSDYVNEGFNDFFKQLMLSDEIYQVLEPSESLNNFGIKAELQPLTLISKNLQFKKQEVDKLINYQFVFKYGTPYKLTL
tara:strand:+ start:1199 stop:2461 length:1263 start_codon:yes stop_codon:yes gene_type:complete